MHIVVSQVPFLCAIKAAACINPICAVLYYKGHGKYIEIRAADDGVTYLVATVKCKRVDTDGGLRGREWKEPATVSIDANMLLLLLESLSDTAEEVEVELRDAGAIVCCGNFMLALPDVDGWDVLVASEPPKWGVRMRGSELRAIHAASEKTHAPVTFAKNQDVLQILIASENARMHGVFKAEEPGVCSIWEVKIETKEQKNALGCIAEFAKDVENVWVELSENDLLFGFEKDEARIVWGIRCRKLEDL